LNEKVAVITGASRGIGEACARRFVAEGATVVIADVLDDEGCRLADELGAAASFHHLDVTSEEGWADAMRAPSVPARTAPRRGRQPGRVPGARRVVVRHRRRAPRRRRAQPL